jgi:hypothetical protein
LVALEAAKTPPCKEISSDVDVLLNALVGYFKVSSMRKANLHAFQVELNDAQESLKRFHKISLVITMEGYCNFM